MAMGVDTYMPDPLISSHKAFNHQRRLHKTTTKAFEIKVIYVRIISTECMGCNMEIKFPSTRDSSTKFQVNGSEILLQRDDGFSMTLNKNRVDTVMAESTYVSTNTIGFCGSLLCFEIRVKGLLFPVLVGVVKKRGRRRDAGCMWVMECRDGVALDHGGLVDVYFAGRSKGKPFLLNGVMDLSKSRLSYIPESAETGTDHNDPKELEEKGTDAGLRNIGNIGEDDDDEDDDDDDDDDGDEGELAWLNAGVGVGMGFGVGVPLGLGIGLGLLLMTRTYQAAAGLFRRFF